MTATRAPILNHPGNSAALAGIAEPVTPKPQSKDFERLIADMMQGRRLLPNVEDVPLERGVAVLASGAGLRDIDGIHEAKIDRLEAWGGWARYFVTLTQGGQFTGEGYVMLTGPNGNGKIVRFAICRHSKVEGSGANHQRGWHPGRCEHCGLDMTVDSGD